ncbi:Uncharacterised protein [uncultured archaeon]|nr:Uncharacterised protein [uncultured archaeon]
MKVYYAHMRCIYGTPQERLEKEQIGSHFPNAEIVDPSLHQDSHEMSFYVELARSCDAIIFSRVDGQIGAGVGKEVNNFVNDRKPAFELLPGGGIAEVKEMVTHLNVPDTIALLEKHSFRLPVDEVKDLARMPKEEKFTTKSM